MHLKRTESTTNHNLVRYSSLDASKAISFSPSNLQRAQLKKQPLQTQSSIQAYAFFLA